MSTKDAFTKLCNGSSWEQFLAGSVFRRLNGIYETQLRQHVRSAFVHWKQSIRVETDESKAREQAYNEDIQQKAAELQSAYAQLDKSQRIVRNLSVHAEENKQLRRMLQELQDMGALQTGNQVNLVQSLAQFCAELVNHRHGISERLELSICKEILLSMQVKTARLVHSVDNFMNTIALYLDPFVTADLTAVGGADVSNEAPAQKTILLCIETLQNQFQEMMTASATHRLGEVQQNQPINNEESTNQNDEDPNNNSISSSSAVDNNPLTWHAPKVVLEPRRDICFPVPIPAEWNLKRHQRVILKWEVTARQGSAMTAWTELSLITVAKREEEEVDDKWNEVFSSDEDEDEDEDRVDLLYSQQREEGELVGGVVPVVLYGFRSLSNDETYKVKIRNTAFMAPVELSYKILLMPDASSIHDISDSKTAGNENQEEPPDNDQLALVSIALKRMETAHYQAEMLTHTYLAVFIRWRRNRMLFRNALLSLAQANKRLVNVQSYQQHSVLVDRLNALTFALSRASTEAAEPTQPTPQQPQSAPVHDDSKTFSAESVKVGAGEDFRIRDGALVSGTKVSWSFSIAPSDGDIGFCICALGTNNGAVTTFVEYRRYVAEVTSPITGEYIFSQDVPSGIEIIFDNSYSWMTAKTVSYQIQVNPPAVVEPPATQPVEILPSIPEEPLSPEPLSPQQPEITSEQLEMEEQLAKEEILTFTETVQMCTAEAESIAEEVRALLSQVNEFWSIHGSIYYQYLDSNQEE